MTAHHRHIAPRLLCAEDAARYLGIGVTKFRELGIQRFELDGRVLWDVRKLDAWIDDQTGDTWDHRFGL